MLSKRTGLADARSGRGQLKIIDLARPCHNRSRTVPADTSSGGAQEYRDYWSYPLMVANQGEDSKARQRRPTQYVSRR